MGARVALYPVSLRVEGRPCLVVGGGKVATRKVAGLVECGAAVHVVAPVIATAIETLASEPAAGPGTVRLHRRPYRAGEVTAYRLVVTATGIPEVDHLVAADADAAGVWVNSADDAEHCTFLLPAIHRDGPVSVAVSTAGASPTLAAWARQRVADTLGAELGTLAALLEEARRRLRDAGRPTDSIDWAALLDGPLPGLVAAGRTADARRLLEAALAPTAGRPSGP